MFKKGFDMDMFYEFFITMVILLGGGFLLFSGKATDAVIAAITAAVNFWFMRDIRKQNKTSNVQAPVTEDTQTKQAAVPEVKPVAQKVDDSNGNG